MRRQIAWLVGAMTSAVILAFVIPLCLLVRTVAEDRAIAAASQEARNVAILVSGVRDRAQLAELVAAVDRRDPARTGVLTPAGDVLGSPGVDLRTDASVRRARGGQAFTDREGADGEVLVPVVASAGTFVVHTLVPEELQRRGVARAWLGIFALGAVLIAAAVVVARRLSRTVSTPVVDLAAFAHRLQDGDLTARAEPTGPPETVELGEALNRLADRIQELLAAERAAVGDLSHRLRTPVTALRLDAESVADPEVGDRLQQHIGFLQRTIDAIVHDARRPLRHTMGSACDATAVVRERMAFWAALAEDQQRSLQVDLPARSLWVPLDPSELTDLVDVLVDNVFAHTSDGVAFAVGLHAHPAHAVLEVRDHGPGLLEVGAAERRAGTSGLGLQIVRRTVAGIGGELALGSEPGGGTTVRLSLPLTAAHVQSSRLSSRSS